ncbi:nitronate monooxygenase [Persicirhabdus sediminis]|uniref:Nitronate monooxygenase n=1 Tax=Persicirhabdus sediminis TaxID=454144 RepID=A0A8J7MGB4_9BACT|nr:nitronate monooxygenase [Persicirhabdus sediminis]MBK1792301.1 nitronate monooxygenase [Persicirhabdus sediminis]
MSSTTTWPKIIQGGMGIGVSNWVLARAVSMKGQLGVVSGTAVDSLIARRLQDGDPEGHVRRAISHFPWTDMGKRILDKYFVEGGKPADKKYKLIPMATQKLKTATAEMLIVSNFVEVFLAKEGHDGVVGINYLEKIQLPTMPSILGAMMAGVNYVLMGAGIPTGIPGILDGLAKWQPVKLKLNVEENPEQLDFYQDFDPAEYGEMPEGGIGRPLFLGIISSEIVAKTMERRATGEVNGYIIENHTAGGHNAPPRRVRGADPDAPPAYTEKDIPNVGKVAAIGKPFYLAGGFGCPEKLQEAIDMGAQGIQVGTTFAYCDESGITREIKDEVLDRCANGTLNIVTAFKASPTGYPFKLIELDEENDVPSRRKRICDLGYLRHMYLKDDGNLGYRCPAEPVKDFVRKGGTEEGTNCKQCLCNGLMGTIGHGQVRDFGEEPAIVTTGEDFSVIKKLIEPGKLVYHASDVVDYFLTGNYKKAEQV